MSMDNPREAKALKVGEPMPDIILRDSTEQMVNLRERLNESALLLVFYRGEW